VGRTKFWLGNHYATRYADASAVFDRVRRDWPELLAATRAWTGTLARSGLDEAAVTHLAAQLVPIRSPTCFRAADGRFFGFEGTLGASTVMWSGAFGGSCPLNCTHVWNYEMALAKAFPELERSMRETELEIMQAPEGYVPHRVVAPTYLRQLWGEPIGGPDAPALDGMLGTVLKTYREYRAGAGIDWLRRYWPNIARLMGYVDGAWNTGGTGMLTGIQPSTHDIDLTGLNTFQGTLWLAALRAAEEMARLLGANPDGYRATFEQASTAYDEALFTGEYYVQKLLPGDSAEFQWVDGCLSDQLIGQWWAHQLGLGYLLPAEHVRTALQSIVRHNLRHGFSGFVHPYRQFADGDDSGLLMCTWPHGGRPNVPTRYADEVWTGSEYQVAAHCLREGLATEGRAVLDAVWARYDGRRRNPYNEIECGDHYVRAMAGWSVLEALAGFDEDGPAGAFTFRQPDSAVPFLSSQGWGLWAPSETGLVLECGGGRIDIRSLTITGESLPGYDAAVPVRASRCSAGTRLSFPGTVSLVADESLELVARPW
jgi:familyl 116 glycosyl hydrolase-like protein